MKKNAIAKANMAVSEIGLGCEHLERLDYPAVKAVIDKAIKCGINILDVFMSEPNVRTNIGRALEGRREQVILQGHIGAAYIDGQYKRTRDPKLCKEFFEDFLARLQTDYVDIGMLHFIDDSEDFEKVFNGEIMRYALELKQKGVIRALGMSSHNPAVALQGVKTGLIDVLMFSINPAYDILPPNEDIEVLFKPDTFMDESLRGTDPVRAELYRACEAKGVAITVMKALGAGTLLKKESSNLGVPLTPAQCIHYALDRPAVVSVLVGARTPEEVETAAGYENTEEQEKDYSIILSQTPKYASKGRCMYCNHCLPCPSKIDIALVNKYLDLATVGESLPDTVKMHYKAMKTTAADCIACGSCEKNCPFDVKIIGRMQKAAEVFGC